MVTPERAQQLQADVRSWQDSLERSRAQLESPLHARLVGIAILDAAATTSCLSASRRTTWSSKAYHRGLIRAEALLAQAHHGNDV